MKNRILKRMIMANNENDLNEKYKSDIDDLLSELKELSVLRDNLEKELKELNVEDMIRNDLDETHYTFMKKCYDIFNKFDSFRKRSSEDAYSYYLDKKMKEIEEEKNK